MNYEELILAGIDIKELLDRFMNNEKLVKIVIGKFLTDTTYQKLEIAVAQNDMKQAEFACHTLKGICGNLALKELFRLLQEQLLLFRSGDGSKAAAMTPEILAHYEKAVDYAAQWINKQ